ncbi:putative ABC transporter permease subunit [Candidatus Electronema sp. TJ]|uniref:putative ABC transporter permease subunit n=1 Tax=Candidatus Electronema sp. TJ TaxID=3401573 RepID=UPI003AA8A626
MLSARQEPFLLFRPFVLGIRNRFFRDKRSSLRTAAVLGLGAALFIALHAVSLRVIGYFHSQSELGIILSLKIFQMAWTIMFAMLIFSSMVSAVSALYLSSDNEILCSAPVAEEELFRMRFATSLLYTSWMMVIYSLPIFGAYGTVFQAGWLYHLLMAMTVLSTALTAGGIGLGATILLVRLFPAKQTKDIAVYLSLLFGILLYLVIRLLKPEDLAYPDKYPDFVEYLSSLQAPGSTLLPPSWANQLLNSYLQDQSIDWLAAGLLLLTPLVLFWAGEWLMARCFFDGFSKAQESFGGSRTFGGKGGYQPSPLRWIFHKEAKLFLRDSAEWSQLFLVGALIVVYLYNFKALPLERSPMPTEYLANLLAFANIGLAGFLATSLAARFVYPSIGAEGPAFLIICSSPLPLPQYLLCKYLFYCIPFTAVTLFLIIASNALLQITGPMWWVSIGVSLAITWSALALALGFGAIYADFKIESRTAAQGSFGMMLFMFVSLAMELLILVVGFWGNYRLLRFWLRGYEIDPLGVLLSVGSLVLILLIGGSAAFFCLKKGLRALKQ